MRAYSAASAPSDCVNPYALEAFGNAGVDTSGYRSKSWDEFVGNNAPQMRIVTTVCDSGCGGTMSLLDRKSGNLGGVNVAVNGKPVETLSSFVAELDRAGIGSTVDLTVVRDDKQRHVKVQVIDLKQ
jgi:S1-C subfamily serine protease